MARVAAALDRTFHVSRSEAFAREWRVSVREGGVVAISRVDA